MNRQIFVLLSIFVTVTFLILASSCTEIDDTPPEITVSGPDSMGIDSGQVVNFDVSINSISDLVAYSTIFTKQVYFEVGDSTFEKKTKEAKFVESVSFSGVYSKDKIIIYFIATNRAASSSVKKVFVIN